LADIYRKTDLIGLTLPRRADIGKPRPLRWGRSSAHRLPFWWTATKPACSSARATSAAVHDGSRLLMLWRAPPGLFQERRRSQTFGSQQKGLRRDQHAELSQSLTGFALSPFHVPAINEPRIGLVPIMAQAACRADNVSQGVGKFLEALRVGLNAGRDFARRCGTPDPYRAHVTGSKLLFWFFERGFWFPLLRKGRGPGSLRHRLLFVIRR
jgi:hypothetical protein